MFLIEQQLSSIEHSVQNILKLSKGGLTMSIRVFISCTSHHTINQQLWMISWKKKDMI